MRLSDLAPAISFLRYNKRVPNPRLARYKRRFTRPFRRFWLALPPFPRPPSPRRIATWLRRYRRDHYLPAFPQLPSRNSSQAGGAAGGGRGFFRASAIAFAKANASAQSPRSFIAAGALAEAHRCLVSRAPTPTQDSYTLDAPCYYGSAAFHCGATSLTSNQGMAGRTIG